MKMGLSQISLPFSFDKYHGLQRLCSDENMHSIVDIVNNDSKGLEIVPTEVLWSIRIQKNVQLYLIQQHEVSFSRMLNDILTLDQLQCLHNRSDFPSILLPRYQE